MSRPSPSRRVRVGDPYVEFTRRFFRRWVGAYDLFASLVGFAYRAVANALAPAPGRRLLDVCTGTGEVALRCARRGARVTGIDLTPEMLLRAASKSVDGRFAAALMDARALGFADSTFDAVSISFALHDMPRPVRLKVLAEAARVARERLVILDYDLPEAHRRRAVVAGAIGLFETPYFRSFVSEPTGKLLAEAGLPAPQRRVLLPGLFSLFTVDLERESV